MFLVSNRVSLVAFTLSVTDYDPPCGGAEPQPNRAKQMRSWWDSATGGCPISWVGICIWLYGLLYPPRSNSRGIGLRIVFREVWLLLFFGLRFNGQAFKQVESGFLLFEVELVEVEGNGGADDREIEVVVGNFLAFSVDEGFGGDFKGAVKSFHFVFFPFVFTAIQRVP